MLGPPTDLQKQILCNAIFPEEDIDDENFNPDGREVLPNDDSDLELDNDALSDDELNDIIQDSLDFIKRPRGTLQKTTIHTISLQDDDEDGIDGEFVLLEAMSENDQSEDEEDRHEAEDATDMQTELEDVVRGAPELDADKFYRDIVTRSGMKLPGQGSIEAVTSKINELRMREI